MRFYLFLSLHWLSSIAWAQQCVEPILARALSGIRQDLGALPDQNLVAAQALKTSEKEIRALITQHEERIEMLEGLARQARVCGGRLSCLTPLFERLRHHAEILKLALWSGMGGERKAKKELFEEAPKIAEQWVDAHLDELTAASVGPSDKEKFTVLLTQRLKEEIQGDRFSLPRFFKTIGSHFLNVFQAFSLKAPFKALRSKPVARADYAKNLLTVLSLQAGAHLMTLGTDFLAGNPMKFWDMLWIYFNTAFMMTIQAEIGARNTTIEDSPRAISTFQEAMQHLPAILHGQDGYWKESKRKIFGFLALLPLDFAVAVGIKSASVAILSGGDTAKAQLFQNAITTMASVAIFGTYLSLRWAMADKWFYLSLLPSLRKTTKTLAEEKRLELVHVEGYSQNSTLPDLVKMVRAKLERSETEEAFLRAVKRNRNSARLEWLWRYGFCLVDSYVVFRLFGNWIPKFLGNSPSTE